MTRLGNGILSEAIRNIDSMFWFGIFEFFDTSLCLLAYQLGQFKPEICSCEGEARSQLTPVSMSSNRSKIDFLSVIEVSDLEEMVLLDNVLYEYSLRKFIRRVEYVEGKTNIPILCKKQRSQEEVSQLKAVYTSYVTKF